MGNSNKKHNKRAKTFITLNTGFYDLRKLFDLDQEKYKDFVLNLFEVEPKPKIIHGIHVDGERFGSNAMVWPFWQYKDAGVDETYLEVLHQALRGRIGHRFYLIAPANAVDFISDYHEIEGIRYYFLKVPYQIIQELHKKEFKKFRQPQSKTRVNDLENAVGFHFMRQPEVQSEFKDNSLVITKFVSQFSEEETGREMDNFESLAMVILDDHYNGKEFIMSYFRFAGDLLKSPKPEETEETESELKTHLRQQQQIVIPLAQYGEKIFVVYVDIYGNEFREELKTGE